MPLFCELVVIATSVKPQEIETWNFIERFNVHVFIGCFNLFITKGPNVSFIFLEVSKEKKKLVFPISFFNTRHSAPTPFFNMIYKIIWTIIYVQMVLEQRCALYFRRLNMEKNLWIFHVFEKLPFYETSYKNDVVKHLNCCN